MASNTSYINLYKKDPVADRNDTFNITTMLNENWDKLDTTLFNLNKDKVDKITGKGLSTNDFTKLLKDKLDGIEVGANKYIHPDNHSLDIITETTTKKIMTNLEREKLEGVAKNANNYSHPLKHPPTIIEQDLNNRFISDLELAQIEDNKTNLGTHLADETTHGIGDKSTLKTTHKISIVGAVNELFLSASSGKTDIASVVGSPASSNNTFAQLKTHIQNAKNKGATNLSAKGTSANGSDTLDLIMTKIASVNTGKKWATGTGMSDSSYKSYTYFDGSGSNQYYPLNVVGLDFKPSYIICFGTGGYEPAFTIYMYDNPVYNTNDSIILGSFNGRMTTTQVINIKLGSGDSSIYLGGFSIPVRYNNVNCRWVAFE